MQMSMFSSEVPRANRSRSRDFARDLLTNAGTSHSPILPLLTDISPSGWFGRTSPASCQAEADGILVPFSGRWSNSGMGSPTECLTLSISEWPSDAAVCSLSDVLEVGTVPPRYFLSAKACQGILRRAEKRWKALPPTLLAALRQVAEASSE